MKAAILRAALNVSDAIAGGDPCWPDFLVERLAGAAGADTVGYADGLDSGLRGYSTNVGGPPLSPEERLMWSGHWGEYPFFSDLLANGVGYAQRASDRIPSLAEFRRSTVYAEHFRPRGARYQANLGLVVDGRIALVGLYRSGHDFTVAEVAALEQSRLLLVHAMVYRAAVNRVEQLARAEAILVEGRLLTPRQEDVLALVATGATDYAIGRRLGISERTVRKHLEDIRRRLHVTSRVAAARWWLTVRSRTDYR